MRLKLIIRRLFPKRAYLLLHVMLVFCTRKTKELSEKAVIFSHHAVNIIYGEKGRHIVITGFSESGIDLLYDLVKRSSDEDIYIPESERSALREKNSYHRKIITKSPLDLINIKQVNEYLSSYREVFFIILIRDPRDLVSSINYCAPHQFSQSYDYQIYIGGEVKSFTNPGLSKVYEKIKEAKALKGIKYLIIKYEDLIEDPGQVRKLINKSTGLEIGKEFPCLYMPSTSKNLKANHNTVRLVDGYVTPSWMAPDRLKRVFEQISIYPEIEIMAREMGYLPLKYYAKKIKANSLQSKDFSGTIIAFYTEDAIYKKEAERFVKCLDNNNLKYEVRSVKSKGEWVENCALKSEYIYSMRKVISGPILYIDVDAIVHVDPWKYLSQYSDSDLSVYIHPDGELISGTILVNDTVNARFLLKKWVEKQKKYPKAYDQYVLQKIIEEEEKSSSSIIVQRLPPNFNYIFDKKYPVLSGPIYIEHLQASREVKDPEGDLARRRKERVNELNNLVS